MNWIKVDDEILLNLNHVESIEFHETEVAYARPFQMFFNTDEREYFLSFRTREERTGFLVKLAKRLNAL